MFVIVLCRDTTEEEKFEEGAVTFRCKLFGPFDDEELANEALPLIEEQYPNDSCLVMPILSLSELNENT